MINPCLANSALSNGLYIHNYTHLITSSAINERLQVHTLLKQLLHNIMKASKMKRFPLLILMKAFRVVLLDIIIEFGRFKTFLWRGITMHPKQKSLCIYIPSALGRVILNTQKDIMSLFSSFSKLSYLQARTRVTRIACFGRNKICEFAQQDGRKKRTAKRLCVTNVTGL